MSSDFRLLWPQTVFNTKHSTLDESLLLCLLCHIWYSCCYFLISLPGLWRMHQETVTPVASWRSFCCSGSADPVPPLQKWGLSSALSGSPSITVFLLESLPCSRDSSNLVTIAGIAVSSLGSWTTCATSVRSKHHLMLQLVTVTLAQGCQTPVHMTRSLFQNFKHFAIIFEQCISFLFVSAFLGLVNWETSKVHHCISSWYSHWLVNLVNCSNLHTWYWLSDNWFVGLMS